MTRKPNGQFKSRKRWLFEVAISLFAFAGMLAVGSEILEVIDDTYFPEPVEFVSPVIDTDIIVEPELDPWEELLAGLSETESKICRMFGIMDCKIALAVSEAENSTRNPEALNYNSNNTFDVGVFQINSIWWDTEECPYGLHELTTVEPNIECAYVIWDRADGTEGDGQGNWSPWTQFNNGVFLNNL